MSLIWTLLMINLGENRVRIIILKYQLPVWCLSEADSTAPHGEVDLLTGSVSYTHLTLPTNREV